jgi:MYXO-CTERM domain-containing protein
MSDRREIDLPEDPTGIDQPHDVLAAEEFAMPARSAGDIPPDPTGIQEPHDVLAAEEFAMPGAGVDHSADDGFIDPRSLIPGALAVLVVLLLLRRRRRRHASVDV